jgi:type IV secretory pathway TraG/TraD family ATPase VirD4
LATYFCSSWKKKDLLIFGPRSPLRFNFLDEVQRSGGDTRDITRAIMVIGETLQDGEGRQSEPFWKQQNERLIYNAVEIVRGALGRVTAPDLQRFITGAAQTPAALKTPEWEAGFHNQCLKAASANARTAIQKHDCTLGLGFWLNEYPAMADKTRSSILAGVMGILHVFNTGIVRELVSTTTNVSPAEMDRGKWMLVDMAISSHGAAGAFVFGGWKYLTQQHILKRHATEETPVCVIWADEAQKVVNSFDASYLAECRSHRGCMVYLTQSIHSFYSRIYAKGGEHETDALLTNFYHKIFHAVGDDKTAAYASSLIGRRLTTHIGGSMSPATDVFEDLFGQSRFTSSFSQQVENVLENREFMQNLRTGGEINGNVVDGIVVRSGEPFSNGEAFLKVAFNQN